MGRSGRDNEHTGHFSSQRASISCIVEGEERGMGIGHIYGWHNVRHEPHSEETSDSILLTGIDELELNSHEEEICTGNTLDDEDAEEDCSDFSDGVESEQNEASDSEHEESDDEIYLETEEMYC